MPKQPRPVSIEIRLDPADIEADLIALRNEKPTREPDPSWTPSGKKPPLMPASARPPSGKKRTRNPEQAESTAPKRKTRRKK